LCDCLGRRLDPSFHLHIPSDLKGAGVWRFSQIDFRCAATIRYRDLEPGNSVLAPCQDGDLEEIFITIIIDVSPSTIHDSPIHV
jgi:hypothetical protein